MYSGSLVTSPSLSTPRKLEPQPTSKVSSLGNTKHSTLQQAEMGEDSNGLGPDVLRAVSLQELDKRAQGHEDLVSVYLLWLQEHLNVWDLSDSAAFRPQIESWYSSLRFHGYQDQHVRDAFTAWVSKQIQVDPSCARRLLVAQEELLSILGGNQTMQPRDYGMDQGTAAVITVREDKIIDISSGDDDSDVEFLGWKRPDNLRSASKSAKHPFPPLTGANKETQRMQGAEDRETNDRLKRTKTAKAAPIRVPSGRPPKNYVCDRCGEKGHFKEQCPTNLDPSFDPKPTGGYQCYCCGAKEQHLTTLCPLNGNPDSVTQQRIKAGVPILERSSPPGETDHYRPPYNQSRKAKKTPSRSMDNASIHENNRATNQFEDDDGHRMDPARRARLERDDRGDSSTRSDGRKRGRKRSHYSPPREGRGRRLSIDGPQRGQQTKRVRRWREASRSDSRSSHSEREGSTELLPRKVHRNSGDGRLSYWDDGYNDIKMTDTNSSEETRRSVPTVCQPSDNLDREIRGMYPDADPIWVFEMAGFDVDEFFHGLGEPNFTASTPSIEEDARMEIDIFSDEDDGQTLPRVRLPPAREDFTDETSDRNSFFHDHQKQLSFDDKPRADKIEEVSRYDFQKGDKDGTSHTDNGEIVVKLPQGGGAALNLDRFSAQLSVSSCASNWLNLDMDPEATNANS